VSTPQGPLGDVTGNKPDPQLMFLEELVEEHASIAGDVIEVDAHTWAIHGSIAVDGEVIMAEYDTEEHARFVLQELHDETDSTDGRSNPST
jgi:hypothetical protein